jgi:hypothetical protein
MITSMPSRNEFSSAATPPSGSLSAASNVDTFDLGLDIEWESHEVMDQKGGVQNVTLATARDSPNNDDLILDTTVEPQSTATVKSSSFWIWLVLLILMLLLGGLAIGFATRVFLKNRKEGGEKEGDENLYDRQAYYNTLTGIFQYPLLEPNSAPGQALEWMSFEDVPLQETSDGRVWQRFALVVWYFAQGGPKLWSSVNSDPTSGWIDHGVGMHECKWRGVDCNADNKVTGLRLGAGSGITLIGTLSTELGVLTNLEHFDMSNHRVQGSIPDAWKEMTTLGL